MKHDWKPKWPTDGGKLSLVCTRCGDTWVDSHSIPCGSEVKLNTLQKEAVALALKELERAYVMPDIVGGYSLEPVRKRRAELLALLGIPEELWKEM